jgi:HlyD family secretion protein
VDFNSEVKAGQLLAQIDPETFEYRVRSAQADVDAARSAVLTAQANSAANRAAVSRADTDLAEAERTHARNLSLVEKGFIAQSEADRTRALVISSKEAVKAAQAQLGVTDAQIKSAQANVAQRDSALAQARIDLERTRITSPITGIIIKRTIEKGQTVASSLQAPELFIIAQNLSDMQVDASVDEADVGRIRSGLKATFTVDAFPGQTFEGEVRQVRKAAQNVANVVTYTAVVQFNNTSGRLLPGMTANVRVVTDQRESALKIPNSALRVRIAGVEPAAAPAPAAPGTAPASSTPASSTSDAGQGFWHYLPFAKAWAQPAPGGGLAAMRERLVDELKLSAEQQGKLDAISNAMRPRFMALRDLPEGERASAREAVMNDMRSQISAMLNAEQKARYAQMNAASAQRPAPNAPETGANSAGSARAGAEKPQVPSSSAAPAAAAPSAPAAPAAGNNPATEFRNRLVAELQLKPDQVEKVDAIYAEARPKFMMLRDMAPEERTKARERITADIRARIGELLTPEQKPKYAALVAEVAGRQTTRGRIYLLGEDGKPRAYSVRLGISDGTSTELLVGPNSPDANVLKEGATVITGILGGAATPARTPPAGGGPRPFF